MVYQGEGHRFGVCIRKTRVRLRTASRRQLHSGLELRAKVTGLADRNAGSLTKKLGRRKQKQTINPQSYGIGIKDCAGRAAGTHPASGYVAPTPWDGRFRWQMYGADGIYGFPIIECP